MVSLAAYLATRAKPIIVHIAEDHAIELTICTMTQTFNYIVFGFSDLAGLSARLDSKWR